MEVGIHAVNVASQIHFLCNNHEKSGYCKQHWSELHLSLLILFASSLFSLEQVMCPFWCESVGVYVWPRLCLIGHMPERECVYGMRVPVHLCVLVCEWQGLPT